MISLSFCQSHANFPALCHRAPPVYDDHQLPAIWLPEPCWVTLGSAVGIRPVPQSKTKPV